METATKSLLRKPIFTIAEAKRRTNSPEYARLLLHRLEKSKKITRIGKGVYATTIDIHAIASNIHFPSYISFLSASAIHGFTTAIPIAMQVATSKRYKGITVMNYDITFHKIPLGDAIREERNGVYAFIAEPETLLVDAFLNPRAMGNFSEIEGVFQNIRNPNAEKICKRLLGIQSKKICRQVGYLLEKYHRIDLGIPVMDKNYYELNPFEKGKNINKKWRLKV
jgi:predicted transcriptional regulator of viral defense system